MIRTSTAGTAALPARVRRAAPRGKSIKINVFVASASVLALGWSCAATAETAEASAGESARTAQVGEVVVTAERRTTNLQTTPIAATVMSGDDLQRKGVMTVEDLQFAAPAVTVNNFGQGIDFNIRGIGKGEHNSQTLTGVITYRDGVATFPGYFTGEPYYDIARVEVLRGPQGTFVGQNATGGAVFVTTNDPVIGGGHSGYVMGQVGNYRDVAAQGALNIPVSDTFAARLAFNTEARDSFYKVTGAGFGDPGNLREVSARLSLLWKPTQALTVSFKTDYSYLDFGAYPADPVLATNDPFQITANDRMLALDRFVRTVLKADYVFGDGVTLRSVTGYQFGISKYFTDLDGTNVGHSTWQDVYKERVFSQELNLISPDKGPVTWVLGAYFQTDKAVFPPGDLIIGLPLGSPFTEYHMEGSNPKRTAAVFGQASLDLSHGFQLQLGARYSDSRTSDHIQIVQYGAPITDEQSQVFNSFSSKVSLNWTVNPHHFLYAFVATGYKPGGLNLPVGLGIPAPFRQEKVTSYEVGWKAGFLGGRVRTQLDAYYNDYRNFQVAIGYPAFPIFSIELNTPNPTRIYGMEAQMEAVFGDLSIDAGVGLQSSRLGTFFATDPRVASGLTCDPATGPASVSCINLDGKRQTYAPNFTFNIGVQYTFRLDDGDTLTPRLNFGHISDQWATLFENAARGDLVEARDILGGQVAWRHGSLITTLYGANLTDQHYVAAVNSGLRFVGPPRQFGVRLTKVF
jgi:iron complex outermembrane recepter protein